MARRAMPGSNEPKTKSEEKWESKRDYKDICEEFLFKKVKIK